MLFSVNNLTKYELAATDGNIGQVKGLYFDPESWEIHYLIVDTKEWLPGRKVLISLKVLGALDTRNKILPLSLSKEQIKDSPAVDEDSPIISLNELNAYYGWQFSLGGDMPSAGLAQTEAALTSEHDIELRSTHEIIGFNVKATDGDIGHVEDFIIDDEKWIVRYVAINTRDSSGKTVLISPDWIGLMAWDEGIVHVEASCHTINSSPEHDRSSLSNKQYEQRLDQYFQEPVYSNYGSTGETETAERKVN